VDLTNEVEPVARVPARICHIVGSGLTPSVRLAPGPLLMDDLTSDTPTAPVARSGLGGVLAGRYEVRKRLGRGATKEVFLVYDTRLDREVALAIVVGASTDLARARVTREAQVTGRLGDHPNVITVYDSGEIDGIPFLVLRAMRGGSLAERLERERPSFSEAIRLAGEIAAALAHAHAHDVIHRDVKPDNVWLTVDGGAALGDFGIAYQIGQERLTAEGVVVGTVRYLAPEQIRGRDIGPACDLYALGVTLYEMVTGRAPFVAADSTQVLAQHLTASPVAPSVHAPALAPSLERLILELLAKDPGQRPPSAADVAAALAAMAAGGDVLPWPRRRGVAAAPPDRAPALAAAPRGRPDARRIVSVLAARADLADPEALHGVFERCAAVIERHGGTVERYLGDTLVGFFGLHESHDDAALRAMRAAVELRSATAELRLGVESGEIFLGAGPRGGAVPTGAPITAAGRLAERAAEGEILLGDGVRRVVATDASVDPASGRLLALVPEQPALLRTPETPFVGRARELGELRAAYEHVCDERACRIVTVVGPPGIGKSRLAGELIVSLGDEPLVLAGRCLAYGEGTTYRALADIVRGLGSDPRGRIERLLAGDEQAIRGILGATGLSGEPAQADETSWAMRRLLERLARDRPVVVAVEDIHWAQPALLDLLDHVAALSSGVPILLVCLTRPDLLESRPSWAAPQPNRSFVVLDALGDAHAAELAERLGAGDHAARIAGRAEGNPLFVEQLVAVDDGEHTGELPASIQAVLAARIDRLESIERALLQRASVEGRTFHAGALSSAPGSEAIGPVLAGLARKGLIGADRAEFAGEDAFRFSHALIREATYAGIPKVLRADLHAGVADWLTPRPAADEIVGYHLEQACVLAAELGSAGERERALAARAVERFKRAAGSALARAEAADAGALLERALALVASDDAARGELLPALGASRYEAGDMTGATTVLDEAIAQSPEPRLQARARIEREFVRLESEAGCRIEESARVADVALPVLADASDELGMARVWSLRAQLAWVPGQVQRADDAWREAAECARRAGDERELFVVVGWRATAAVLGPAHVDGAIRRCEEFRELTASSPVAVMCVLNPLAQLHAMRGDFELAERLLDEANETRRELGNLTSMASHHEASIRMRAGQPALAEAALRASVEVLGPVGDSMLMATTNAMLAQAVYAQGRPAEAAELCLMTANAVAEDDIFTQVIWRSVHAKVLALEGCHEQAIALAREAVSLIEPTDLLSHHGDAMLDLAEVLDLCGRAEEGDGAARAALSLYDAKGNAAAAAPVRALLENRSPT
jgi:tetratricopeptide (TPR) repeat protein